MTVINRLEKNPNVSMTVNKEEDHVYIEVLPCTREITLAYVKRIVESIFAAAEDLKEHFGVSSVVFCTQGFCIDGLFETNDLLVSDGSILQNTYNSDATVLRI
jgi:hypothetical protein